MKRWAALLAVTLGLVSTPLLASAAAPNVSRSYTATQVTPAGALVSLVDSAADKVAPATLATAAQLIGVAVNSQDSLLAINPVASKVQVATTGSAPVLVSTLNGALKAGDMVAVSPVAGVGMKARAGDHVVGMAQAAFSATATGAEPRQITDTAGHTHQVSVGYVLTNLAVGQVDQNGGGQVLNGWQRFAKSLTGRTLSTARVVSSLVIAIAAVVALITLVYAAVYGGVISIGRNPLAKFAVLRTVTGALFIASMIAVLASLAIFWLLR